MIVFLSAVKEQDRPLQICCYLKISFYLKFSFCLQKLQPKVMCFEKKKMIFCQWRLLRDRNLTLEVERPPEIWKQWFRKLDPFVLFKEDDNLLLLFFTCGANIHGFLFPRNNQNHADLIIMMSAYSWFLDKLSPKYFAHCRPVFLCQSISEAAVWDYLRGWSKPPVTGCECCACLDYFPFLLDI